MKLFVLPSGDIVVLSQIEGLSSISIDKSTMAYMYYVCMISGRAIPLSFKTEEMAKESRNTLVGVLEGMTI
jgi:hypothetical protein